MKIIEIILLLATKLVTYKNSFVEIVESECVFADEELDVVLEGLLLFLFLSVLERFHKSPLWLVQDLYLPSNRNLTTHHTSSKEGVSLGLGNQ